MPVQPTTAFAWRRHTALALALCGLLGAASAQQRPAVPPARPASAAPPPRPAASADALTDAVARCEAKPDGPEKRACRRALAHQATGGT